MLDGKPILQTLFDQPAAWPDRQAVLKEFGLVVKKARQVGVQPG